MKILSIISSGLIFSLILFSCKKDNTPEKDLTTPVGFYTGSYDILLGNKGSMGLLLKNDLSGTEYRLDNVVTTDTTTMGKRPLTWKLAGTDLEITSGYWTYKIADVKAPITNLKGVTGYYSLGTWTYNGSFNLTRK